MAYPSKSSWTSDCDHDQDPATLRAHDVHEKGLPPFGFDS